MNGQMAITIIATIILIISVWYTHKIIKEDQKLTTDK